MSDTVTMARQVSFTRARSAVPRHLAGLAALVYPVILVGLAIDAGFRRGGDLADLAASFLGTLLFLTAAPTAWIFSIDFIDVERFTVIVAGVLSSFPLWWLLGARLSEGAAGWPAWLVRYLAAAFTWSAFHLVVFAVLGSLFG